MHAAHVAVLPDADCRRCYSIRQGLTWREWHLGLVPRAPPPDQRPQRWLTLLRYKAYARGALATLTCVRACVRLCRFCCRCRCRKLPQNRAPEQPWKQPYTGYPTPTVPNYILGIRLPLLRWSIMPVIKVYGILKSPSRLPCNQYLVRHSVNSVLN